MKVTVEPLAVGSEHGPRVWIIVRRAGGHVDMEEAPDTVKDSEQARQYASRRWNVPVEGIEVKPVQVVLTTAGREFGEPS